jgi:hypothetical protein
MLNNNYENYRKIPIHSLKFEGDLTMEDFEKFKIYFNEFLELESFTVCFDLSNVSSVNTTLMLQMIKYISEKEVVAKKKMICTAILINSVLIKNVLDAFFSLKSPISPNLTCQIKDEAIEFIRDNIDLWNITNKPLCKRNNKTNAKS